MAEASNRIEFDINTAYSSLEQFVMDFNSQQDFIARQEESSVIQRSIMAADKREIKSLKADLDTKDEIIKLKDGRISECEAVLLSAERLARKHEATEATLEQYKLSNDKLRAELKALKSLGCIKKAKEQIKRVKAKSEVYQSRVKQLEKEARIYVKENKDKQAVIEEANRMIRQNHVNDDQVGIYHNGDHHLIVWQQVLSPQYDGKAEQKQRALLHLNRGGTGRLVFFDKDTDDIVISKPPSRYSMPKDVREFATDWLKRVNIVQGGKTLPKDFEQVNLN